MCNILQQQRCKIHQGSLRGKNQAQSEQKTDADTGVSAPPNTIIVVSLPGFVIVFNVFYIRNSQAKQNK